mgnify:FL=1
MPLVYCGVAPMDHSAYVIIPVPFIAVERAYGTFCAISLYTTSNMWTRLSIRFCVALFSWEICVGLRWSAR